MEPRYREIRRDLTQRIAAGEWRAGTALPAEARLARHYGVAIGTLRRAIDELVAERVVVRRQGSGTYVATHSTRRLMFHFFHVVPRAGGRQLPRTRTLAFSRGRARADEARRLRLAPGAPVYRVRNLLSLGERPVILDELVLPQRLFPGFSRKILTGRDNTIYHLYQTRYGVNVLRTSERLRAVRAGAAAARALGVAPGAPLLRISRIALSFDDAPVELRESFVDTSAHDYFLDLGRAER
ncbi:MAG: GntR family transcriptional regulator [Burkholderiales bacterium]